MSVKVMTLVWDYSHAGPEAVPVLLALADRSDDDGVCWPSIDDLARRTRRSESSVRRHIRALQSLGELVVEEVPGRTNRYQIDVGLLEARWKAGPEPTPSGGCQGDTPVSVEGCHGGEGPLSPVEGAPVTGDTRTVKNHQEPSKAFYSSTVETSNAADGRDDVERSFVIWYARYPRKTARARALRAYRAALKHGATPDDLLDGLTRYKFDRRPEFIPHPATWLNDGRWADETAPTGDRIFNEQTQTWVTAPASDDELVFDPGTQTYRRGRR